MLRGAFAVLLQHSRPLQEYDNIGFGYSGGICLSFGTISKCNISYYKSLMEECLTSPNARVVKWMLDGHTNW